jgi:GDP-4-dehydro-6-deoxy-D-mannose reductase
LRALITGIAGFVGKHLSAYLLKDYADEIIGIDINTEGFFSDDRLAGLDRQKRKKVSLYNLDLEDSAGVDALIKETQPECIYHLAAQASVGFSWENPVSTFSANVFGGVNVLEAIKKLDICPKTLIVCTAEEYAHPSDGPIAEDFKIFPSNPYAISKAALDFFALTYHRAFGLPVFVSRSFNHIGPGQSDRFVVSDFAKQIAQIEKGKKEPKIYVGNLQAKRDFLDVRDVVSAYKKIIDSGIFGQAYNVCSSHCCKIEDLLKKLILYSKQKDIAVIADQEKIRPVDNEIIVGDNRKIKRDTGWSPRHNIDEALMETLDWWRSKIQ